jgi:hypothetical protein
MKTYGQYLEQIWNVFESEKTDHWKKIELIEIIDEIKNAGIDQMTYAMQEKTKNDLINKN